MFINVIENTYLVDIMGVVFNIKAHFYYPTTPKMVFHIRDNIESNIKCVATGDHAYASRMVKRFLNSYIHDILMMMIYGLRPKVDYLTSGPTHVCRRLRSPGNRYLTLTLMFGDTGL
ncbi:LOW QUALITY PROTEIN: hypothetical protein HID58_057188 [Brassica napus]|uniref:Uncharacterized protein n=1 Tax=Brassica napus TaxID=3708 RepID=A0ABQ8AQD4_BRANA|nr:LOW QUALITY PROTEIN: hypothetical protein HID58_057188 [Brassica napus]